eukprot:6458993-Amphidinium_carterae.7
MQCDWHSTFCPFGCARLSLHIMPETRGSEHISAHNRAVATCCTCMPFPTKLCKVLFCKLPSFNMENLKVTGSSSDRPQGIMSETFQ